MAKAYLIVPCYNEEGRLPSGDFLALAERLRDLTLLFVDDGSSDATARVVETMRAASAGSIELHRMPRNVGKAEAVRAGLRLALSRDADIVGYTDADLATPAAELERMLRTLEASARPVLFASRVRLLGHRIERHPVRHYLGRIFATLASLALRIPVYDTQCGAKLFRRTDALSGALDRPFRSRWIFDVELVDRLLRGDTGAAPLSVEDFEELPLRAWRDVAGSKLRSRTMLCAGLELLALLLARRLAPRHARTDGVRANGAVPRTD